MESKQVLIEARHLVKTYVKTNIERLYNYQREKR